MAYASSYFYTIKSAKLDNTKTLPLFLVGKRKMGTQKGEKVGPKDLVISLSP